MMFEKFGLGVYSSEADPPFRHIDPSIQECCQDSIPAY